MGENAIHGGRSSIPGSSPFNRARALPWYFWLGAATSLAFLLVSVVSALSGHLDWAGYQFTASVFVVAFATLLATLPSPAQLWIERQRELGIDDVLFSIYPEPPLGNIPRDILFQVHIAVANMGGRKAVLSSLTVDRILDIHGEEIHIPTFSLPVQAQRVQQGGGWRIENNVMSKHQYLEFIPGPYVLDPDDVITMRLRARPGIDWSAKWTLLELKALYDAINMRPIKSVRVTATYRYADRVKTDSFSITDLIVLKQQEFADAIKAITSDFAVHPNAPERAITD